MPITGAQIEHFYREGYVLVPDLIPRPIVDGAIAVAEAQLQAGFQDHFDQGGTLNGWQPANFDRDNPQKNDPDLHGVLWEPALIETIAQVLMAPPQMIWGMLAKVPPGGHGLPWHQDNMYMTILGGALNAFIALRRITPDMGGLWVAPRSHIGGMQMSTIAGEDTGNPGHKQAVIEPDNGIPMPTMEPGDACIFDRNTMHRSVSNETDVVRHAYAAQFCSTHARYAETGRLVDDGIPVAKLAEMMTAT